MEINFQKAEGGLLILGVALAEPLPKLLLVKGLGSLFDGEHLVRGNVQHLADPQEGLHPHIHGATLNVGIGAVGQARGLGNFGLGEPHAFANGEQIVSDGAKIKNQHHSSSKQGYIGIILPF